MANKTNNWNAYESSTTGPFVSGADTFAVENADGLVAPIYLVIDPDFPDKREWILVRAINGTVLENVLRGLEGSAGTPGQGIDHDTGAKVRSVPTKQIFDDIFQDIVDNTSALGQHIGDPGDPHASASYLKLTAADQRYVNVVGDTMQGVLNLGGFKITNLAEGTQSGDAINWDQFQSALGGAFDGDHASLSNVTADQHHTKYTDAEAINAMGAKNDNNDLNHDRYLDSEAVSAVAAADTYYTKAEVDSLLNGKANSTHNHTAAQTTSGSFVDARIPNLNASKVTAGIFNVARIPNLNANKITAGTFGAGNFTFPGLVGMGQLEVAGTVNFTNLGINAGGSDLRLVGTSVQKSA